MLAYLTDLLASGKTFALTIYFTSGGFRAGLELKRADTSGLVLQGQELSLVPWTSVRDVEVDLDA